MHEACEALGVPILTVEGFEADDVIGTLATKAAADRASRSPSSPATRISFSSSHDGITVYNPRDEGTWYDADGVDGEVRRHAGAGRRRARADGRHDRQRQGRARHRREGRARSDRDLRHRSTRCSRTRRRSSNKRYREGAARHAEDARQSRELVRDPDRRAGGRSTPKRSAIAARRASAASSCSRGSASARSSWSTRRRPTADRQGLRASVDTLDGAARAGRRAARGRTLRRCACCRTRPSAMRAAIVGLAFSTATAQARYVPVGAAPAAAICFDGDGADARRPALDALSRPLLEDRAIAKVGHDLKFDAIVLARHGVDAARPRVRHDARELPARRRRGRRIRSRIWRSSTSATRRSRRGRLRPRRQGAVARADCRSTAALDFAGERADLALQLVDDAARRCSRRSELDDGLPRARAAADPGARRRSSAPASAIDGAGARGAVAAHRARAGAARSAQIFELAGEEFNINSPKQLVGDPLRQAAAAGA